MAARKAAVPKPQINSLEPGVRAWLTAHYKLKEAQITDILRECEGETLKPVDYTAHAHLEAERVAFGNPDAIEHWMDAASGYHFMITVHEYMAHRYIPIRDRSRTVNEALGKVSPYQWQGDAVSAAKAVLEYLENMAVEKVNGQLAQVAEELPIGNSEQPQFESGHPNKIGEAPMAKKAERICRNDWANKKEDADKFWGWMANAWQNHFQKPGGADAMRAYAHTCVGVGPTGSMYDFEGTLEEAKAHIRQAYQAEQDEKAAKERMLAQPEPPDDRQEDADPLVESVAAQHGATVAQDDNADEPMLLSLIDARFTLLAASGVPVEFSVHAGSPAQLQRQIANVAAYFMSHEYTIPPREVSREAAKAATPQPAPASAQPLDVKSEKGHAILREANGSYVIFYMAGAKETISPLKIVTPVAREMLDKALVAAGFNPEKWTVGKRYNLSVTATWTKSENKGPGGKHFNDYLPFIVEKEEGPQ